MTAKAFHCEGCGEHFFGKPGVLCWWCQHPDGLPMEEKATRKLTMEEARLDAGKDRYSMYRRNQTIPPGENLELFGS